MRFIFLENIHVFDFVLVDSLDFVRDGSLRYFFESSKLLDHAVVRGTHVVGCQLGIFDGFCETRRLEWSIAGAVGDDGGRCGNGSRVGPLRVVLSPACDFGCGTDQLDERVKIWTPKKQEAACFADSKRHLYLLFPWERSKAVWSNGNLSGS